MELIKTSFDKLELESLERQMLLHKSEILSSDEAKYLDMYVPTGVQVKFGLVLANRKPNHVYFAGSTLGSDEKRLFLSLTIDDAVFYGKERGLMNPAVYKPEQVKLVGTRAMEYLHMLPTVDREDEEGNKELIADNGVGLLYSSINHRLNPQFEGHTHWKPSFFSGIFNIEEAYVFMRLYADLVNNAFAYLGTTSIETTNNAIPRIKQLTKTAVALDITHHQLSGLRYSLNDSITPDGLRILK